jgi:hypothetical protein
MDLPTLIGIKHNRDDKPEKKKKKNNYLPYPEKKKPVKHTQICL